MGSSIEEAIAARLLFHSNNNIDVSAFEEATRQSFIDLGLDPDDPEDGLLSYYASTRYRRENDPQRWLNPFLNEVPEFRFTIDVPIAMGRNEVTREEWAVCVADGVCERGQTYVPPDEFISCDESSDCEPTPDARVAFRKQFQPPTFHPRGPMVGITYFEMEGYVSWLNDRVGADLYRIPTEAEWEYAARAGTNTRYAQGESLTLDQANFTVLTREFLDGEFVWNRDIRSPTEPLPVDELDAANPWGMRHMSGNVSEFTSMCAEGLHRSFTSSSEYLHANSSDPSCEHSLKGGMYSGYAELARPARRVGIPSDHWSPSTGFRVVRDLEPDLRPSE
nr:formylglycine-generating enzyme family protein [Octadecabacter algicola]